MSERRVGKLSMATADNGHPRGSAPLSRPLMEGEILGPRGGVLRPFPKGTSGCPQGRNLSVYHTVRRICSQNSEEAARIQVELMHSEDDRIRFMATMAVLERGVGKPRNHDDEDAIASRIDITGLNKEERAMLGGLLSKVLGGD